MPGSDHNMPSYRMPSNLETRAKPRTGTTIEDKKAQAASDTAGNATTRMPAADGENTAPLDLARAPQRQHHRRHSRKHRHWYDRWPFNRDAIREDIGIISEEVRPKLHRFEHAQDHVYF